MHCSCQTHFNSNEYHMLKWMKWFFFSFTFMHDLLYHLATPHNQNWVWDNDGGWYNPHETWIQNKEFQDDIIMLSSHWPLGDATVFPVSVKLPSATEMPIGLIVDKSTFAQVMALCNQATSHYLSQCWLRFMWPYGIMWPQLIDSSRLGNAYMSYWTRPPLVQISACHLCSTKPCIPCINDELLSIPPLRTN